MNTAPSHLVEDGNAVDVFLGDALLLRYVHRPATSADESPRPYAHPVRSLAGETLTNFRPNDHRWHHGLSFTIASVSGRNFWGGPSYRAGDGYQWRGDHGVQEHLEWRALSPHRIAHSLAWRAEPAGEILLEEERSLEFAIHSPKEWSLHWVGRLANATSRALELGQYRSAQGLAGSHYTGLQFRGTRDLLDDHGDATIGIAAEGGLEGEDAVHGAAGRWMEWRCQKDDSQRRAAIRFEANTGPAHWFVRRGLPLAALAFHLEQNIPLAPGESLSIDNTIRFTDA